MSEFNGRKFYGFPLQNDPLLSTTTRNFEFKYVCPSTVENAIKKLQISDADKEKKLPFVLNKKCKTKLKKHNVQPVTSRDQDIETEISQQEFNKVRTLSRSEIDQLIDQAKSNAIFNEKIDVTSDDINEAAGALQEQESFEDDMQSTSDDEIANYASATTVKFGDSVETLKEQCMDWVANEKEAFYYDSAHELLHPQPQWVNVNATDERQQFNMATDMSDEYADAAPYSPTASHISDEQQIAKHNDNELAALENDCYEVGVADSDAELEYQAMQQYERTQSSPNFFADDSDLEIELMHRADYSKYCENKPPEEDMLNVSHGSGDFPEFVEIEYPATREHFSYLRNTASMLFTDKVDSLEELNQAAIAHEDEEDQLAIQSGVQFIRAAQQESPPTTSRSNVRKSPKSPASQKSSTQKKPTALAALKDKPTKTINLPASSASLKSPRSKRITSPKLQRRGTNQATPRAATPQSVSPTTAPRAMKQATPRSTNYSKTRVAAGSDKTKQSTSPLAHRNFMHKNKAALTTDMDNQKRIEKLKMEKVQIFSKMSKTHQRIIEVLDRLRMCLLEIYVPESTLDKTRRQKNAFEFSVRFSRNYMYPIKGMMDDIMRFHKDDFNSIYSNDACSLLSNTYTLLQQALCTYQKQVRLFLIDQVPQKLATLIGMVQSLTCSCLARCIFDKNDMIVEVMQERCLKFLHFIKEIHNERCKTMREKVQKKKTERTAHYDLKMCMNSLNMYEPKLMPKQSPHRRRIGRKQQPKVTGSCSEMADRSIPDAAFTTQVQVMENSSASHLNLCASSSQHMPATVQQKHVDMENLNQNILDALEDVTREQVRQVLNPLIQGLGEALDQKIANPSLQQAQQDTKNALIKLCARSNLSYWPPSGSEAFLQAFEN